MANGNLTISLESDAYEVFKATRIIHCRALDCKYHSVNFDRFSDHAECTLKRVYITNGGACMQYEPRTKDKAKDE